MLVMGHQQQVQEQEQSRHHACGHARSIEAQVVKTEKEYQDGVNLPSWFRKDDAEKDAVIGVREYQEYAETRESVFSMFPQLDTEVLEAEIRKHASNRQSSLVDVMERLSVMAERLEVETPTPSSSTSNICKFAHVKVMDNYVINSESSLASLKLAMDMLADYDKAKGHRHAHRMKKKLHSITCVHNPVLEAKFKQCRNRFEKDKGGVRQKEFIMYHGTSLQNAITICRNGFDKTKIKSQPRGFFFATWPGVPLKYGGHIGTVVLACKVLLGNVRFEKNGTSYNPHHGITSFVNCDSLVRECTKDEQHEGPDKPVTRRIFILSEADQILPVGMFNYYSLDYPNGDIPTSDVTFNWEHSRDHTRVVSPSELDMTRVREAIDQLRCKPVWPGDPNDSIRKIKYFEDMIGDYKKRDLCAKCGVANSKTTSAALAEFLDWADSMLDTDCNSFPSGKRYSELQQEATYYMEDDDELNEEGAEEDLLYESDEDDEVDE